MKEKFYWNLRIDETGEILHTIRPSNTLTNAVNSAIRYIVSNSKHSKVLITISDNPISERHMIYAQYNFESVY